MLIQSEDQRFYEHKGFDLKSTGRALLKNLQTGAKAEGGSSITQQLAKNLYFYFGNGQYGIEATSRYYYGVSAFELYQEQSQELVKTIKSPSLFNPKAMQIIGDVN